MFGMGGSEIVVILIVALLFLGPDKLPQAAKSISKGIRDIKKQSRSLQQQIENDEQIGGAIRDLKSALRGEDPVPPRPLKPRAVAAADPATALPTGTTAGATTAAVAALPAAHDPALDTATDAAPDAVTGAAPTEPADHDAADLQTSNAPPVRLPPTAGEPDPDVPVTTAEDDDDLRSLIRPAEGAIAKGSEPKHG